MAYDRYTTTHHLTATGWVSGEDRPTDAVETWICNVNQPSGWSKEDRDWHCSWANKIIAREVRDELRRKYAEKVGMKEGNLNGVRVSVGNPL